MLAGHITSKRQLWKQFILTKPFTNIQKVKAMPAVYNISVFVCFLCACAFVNVLDQVRNPCAYIQDAFLNYCKNATKEPNLRHLGLKVWDEDPLQSDDITVVGAENCRALLQGLKAYPFRFKIVKLDKMQLLKFSHQDKWGYYEIEENGAVYMGEHLS